jgi:DNA-binding LacI/PurR family transcriptional regulator
VRNSDRVTINDVAAEAAVSPTAVSQILNDKGNFPDETKQRVREVANKLGYRPSRAAASLRTGKTHTVGMVVTGSEDELWSSQWVQVTARLLVDAAEELNRRNYSLLVIPATGLETLSNDVVDAVIVSDSLDDDPFLEAAIEANIPVVTNDRLVDERVSVHVDSGYGEMAEFSFDLFLKRGRTRPALLTEPSEFHSDATAERVWRAMCEKHGVDPLIERVAYDRTNLHSAVHSLLDQGADAIFSFAGEGITVADIVRDTGKSIGPDVFLISSEMDSASPTVAEGISTLVYHAEKGAKVSVPVLLEILEDSLSAPQTVTLGWEFVEASSTDASLP